MAKDSNIHVVVKGDTLYSIAVFYGTSVSELLKLNPDIADPNKLTVGQKIVLFGDAPATPTVSTSSSRATISVFGLQSNTDRTVYASWKWSQSNTKEYQLLWSYDTGDGMWFVGSDSTSRHYDDIGGGQDTYNAPNNAKRVKFKVKPISETQNVNGTATSYWTASWSTEHIYDFADNPPGKPGTPTVSIDKYLLEAYLANIPDDINATVIQFQVVKDYYTIFSTSNTTLREGFNYARYTCYVDAGSEYKVRCRARRDDKYSDWSDYSSSVSTIPSTPTGITTCRASSETSVYLEWPEVAIAKRYDLEYTTKKEYFDGSDQTTTVNGIEYTHYEKTGLEPGQQYFFRVRAANDSGESGWSDPVSIIIGKAPAAPTTWSSSTTVVTGEDLNLYWVHNAEDGSSQTYAELELYVNGTLYSYVVPNSTNEDERDKTSVYSVNTSQYVEGTKLQWRVRTRGITENYGDWSIQRSVDIYAPATITLSVTDSDGDFVESLNSFPIHISASAGPKTQTPTGYHLSIVSNEVYETVDAIGNRKTVNKGDQVYSKYFDIDTDLSTALSAGDVDLENNIRYTVSCVVSMNSGLTAEASSEFTVAWADGDFEPNCDLGIDTETFTASIRPYCQSLSGELIDDVVLAVYRREFDGSFTELISGITNDRATFVTDPHPALDLARYRIVATSKTTGAVGYYDVPGYPVGGKSVIIQWDESWTTFDTSNEDEMEQPAWSGSMLKLPYNIDVSDDHKMDVALIEYIGRSHPISYYGTQLGTTSTWNVEIAKSDKETLYALRRLARWMGDVYVREPSGSGYWANITVSFSQKHCEVTIPVTLNVTRVEGGI